VLIDFSPPGASLRGRGAGDRRGGGQAGARRLVTIGVTLTQGTLKNLPEWIAQARHRLSDHRRRLAGTAETDDAWHVDGIPALIMVGPDGLDRGNELVGASADETARNIEAAFIRPAPRAPPRGAAAPSGPAKPAGSDPWIRAMSASRRRRLRRCWC